MNIELASKLLKDGREEDLYRLARFCYSCGSPIISDEFYTKLEDTLIERGKCAELISQSQDDDDVPVDLLEEFNMTNLIYSNRVESEYFRFLDSEKSMSIKALIDYGEFYNYCRATPSEDKIFSPKKDGINLKNLYVNGVMELATTRGRKDTGACFDVTENLSKVVPHRISTDVEHVIVYGECGVDKSKVSSMPRKTGGDFSQSKTAAMSIMRTGLDDETYYKFVKFHAFGADGVSNTVSGTIDKLKEWGFDTVPYIIVRAQDIPKNFEEFCDFTKSMLDKMWELSKEYDMETDGVVVDINDKNFIATQSGHYLSRNCALKFEYWSHKYYVGIVKNIIVEQQAVDASAVIEIEPFRTSDNCAARRITSYNPSYLFSLGLYKGQKVYFERNSNAINIILTGQKLKKALGKTNLNTLEESNSFKEEEKNGEL